LSPVRPCSRIQIHVLRIRIQGFAESLLDNQKLILKRVGKVDRSQAM
jgi:hypothetical protein